MKTRLRWSFTITACTLLMVNIALSQETLKQESSASVTFVTAGDISVTQSSGRQDHCVNQLRSRQSEIRRHANYDFRPVFLRCERRRAGGEGSPGSSFMC